MNLQALASDSPAIVYVDFKSPYAYLAIEPTRELERELGLSFDWRPFVLDIPSYLGSARLDKSGAVAAQDRSPEQWSGVKYAYYDCRRYGSLRNMTIRGTVKIWDTNLAATAMLWVRQHHPALLQRFIDQVYRPFWKRELDLESAPVIEQLLNGLGVSGEAFTEWAIAEGREQNAQLQSSAFAAGIFGVPTYVVGDQLFFGREHLPRIHWLLSGRRGAAPDIANPLPSPGPEPGPLPERISIGVDASLDSLLALPRLLDLLAAYPGDVDWIAVPPRRQAVPPAAGDQSRGAVHKRWRVRNRDADLQRYNSTGVSPNDCARAIDQLLERAQISLAQEGPEQLIHPAMPGIVVLLDEELFIGRAHLPLIAARLGLAS